MLFNDLVEVSKRVASATHKKEKISPLAEGLKQGRGQEIAQLWSLLK